MLWEEDVPGPQGSPGHFDVCGPLPDHGVTILEASAGTGKTFTIAALVARLVAEGVAPLSEILVVTFTRMATGELRDRVRDRLVSAERGLGRLLDAGEEPPPGDRVMQLLAEGGSGQVADRRHRLEGALASFDAATITTTHGFCHTMLSALGVWGEVAAGADLVEDPTDLVEEVVDDLLVRHVLVSGKVPFRRKVALGAGLAAVTTLDAALDPPPDRADATSAGLLRRLGAGVREEVERRLVDDNLLTYDDILVRLARALDDDARGAMACARLRERFRVVLVDEFQDTDPVQWQVVRRAFGDGVTRLVLIGDPKQAVYSFRGADVYAYLDAARTAQPQRRLTLEQNWRSDAGLLAAYDCLLRPLHLGHPEIVYRVARASPDHQRPGLQGQPVAEPLRARLVLRSDHRVSRTKWGYIQKDFAVKFVAEDLASDVVGLLASGARLVNWDQDGQTELLSREIGPGDIGVLVRTNRQATVVQAALRSVGVPVVVAGAVSVFATRAARDWLRLLEALQQPASRPFAVAAALTPFIGMTPQHVAGADERTWEELHGRLVSWGALLQRSGVATLFAHIASEGLPARLLEEVDGERLLTDLGHIAELLHNEATHGQLGLAALRAWLARRIDEPTPEGAEAEQRSRRLDSGADAVQVLTVHRAKGLEFPVVYCPYLWDPATLDRIGGPVVFHDRADADRRKLDVGGDKDDRVYMSHFRASKEEKRGEDLRHLYVALTRARNQTVIWWAGATESEQSALGRLLVARGPGGDVEPEGRSSAAKDDKIEAELRRRAAQVPGLISVEHCTGPVPGPPWPGPSHRATGSLSAASFDRYLDLGWRRSSYTSITAGAHGAGRHDEGPADLVGSEPEDPGTYDEPINASGAAIATAAGTGPDSIAGDEESLEQHLRSVSSLLSAMPAGRDFGTFVHRVLERVDFAGADVSFELSHAISDQRARYPGDVVADSGLLASGLEAAISAPLGGLTGGARLRDLRRSDRLDELNFEFPVAGGDKPVGELIMADLAALFDRHIRPDEPLGGYGRELSAPHLEADLRGYLTGSLDLVFRWSALNGAERYFVVDYKTNRLSGPSEDATAWHYRPVALEAEMRRSHYPLQAVLYLVALHRYLRWRVPGYDPDVNLGGALYLFLRGMACPGAPLDDGHPCGVFAWRPPSALVTELSDLLAGFSGITDGGADRHVTSVNVI